MKNMRVKTQLSVAFGALVLLVMAITSNQALHESLKALKAQVAQASDVADKDRALVNRIEQIEARYEPIALAIVDLAASGQREEAIDKMNRDCRPLLVSLLSAAKDYVDYSRTQAKDDVAKSEMAYLRLRTVLLWFSVLAAAVAAVLAWYITHGLVQSLGAEPSELSLVAGRVAQGDLSPVGGASHALPGSVLASMAQMQQQLVGLIGQVRTSAECIASASNEISLGNSDLSMRTEQQASALEEAAASME